MKRLPYAHKGLVKGDTLSLAISMASLVAKVTRDRLMRELDAQYPQYDFCSNKGYGAPLHLKALKEIGPTMHHRPRFLRNLLGQDAPKEKRSEEQCQLSFG
jgi:ribonuclease HII